MPVLKICESCGQEFSVKPRDSHQKCCSKPCQKAYEAIHGRPATRRAVFEFACRQCGGPFTMKSSYLSEYRKRHGKDPMYCSIPCSALGRKADTMKKNTFTCIQCGKVNHMRRYIGQGRTVYYRQQKFCDTACKAIYQSESARDRFIAGNYAKFTDDRGYVQLHVPTKVTGKKSSILEHRFVMEKSLGRKLRPEETVHHINGIRDDNRLENLELFSSRHGPGQRVTDKVAFAIEILRLYTEFARQAGVTLVEHVNDEPPPVANGSLSARR